MLNYHCHHGRHDFGDGNYRHFNESGGRWLIIENVPCRQCSRCGKTQVTDEVRARLDALSDRFLASGRDVSVLDYKAISA